MNIDQAKILWQSLTSSAVIEQYSGSIFNNGSKPLWAFHPFADGKPTVGAIKLSNPDMSQTFRFLVIDWDPNKGEYYLVVFPEDKSRPLIEIWDCGVPNDGIANLCWLYSPSKRDGRNEQRKRYFRENYGDTKVYIDMPSGPDTAHLFVQEVFTLVDNRLKADELSERKPIERDGFPEGKEHEIRHVQRERSPLVVRLAKEEFLRKHGGLFCQACERDFSDTYGQIASRCIEAHHTIPISQLTPNSKTKVSDIALVCANCHRVLHKKRPWLTIDDLGAIIRHGDWVAQQQRRL